ncbi:MAG TPA: caspase family protein [Casimicrobiaceae bacterium]|nr:caspase family protein [Casimicrobiaceae bacterium]
MASSLTILCVHGVGHQELDPDVRAAWQTAITAAVRTWDPNVQPTIDFLEYDALFDHAPLNLATYGIAMGKLLASAIVHGVGDAVEATRGLGDVPEKVKWTAGMVAQWSTEDELRANTRNAVLAQMKKKSYDVVCAHSLGSLISYDTFARNPAAIQGKVFVSLGSQIGNPAVRDVFAGRIVALEAREWYHLFNPEDHVLTYPINLTANNFQQVTTQFDVPNDLLNHDATWYLGHANAVATVWRDLVGGPQPKSFTSIARGLLRVVATPTRRALLVGINDYPDPRNKLEGCVNDAFLMSSVLQECGFNAGEIRVVLNDRATTQAILDRLHWLLDDVHDGDQRMLFYSGHGAQIPEYGPQGEPDHVDECLVPFDFDWSPAHAITDKQFCEFYSQLPYESHFVAVFDCCHSGGLTRDGGPRVRGLTPPDDIRHRALRWNPREQMWVARSFPAVNKSLADSRDGKAYLGQGGSSHRLGRASTLRTLPKAAYDATRKELGHLGPYLPILMEACQETELSYEYRHGATSYGAYTFCLAQVLRANREGGTNLSYAELSALAAEKLHRLEYHQTPALVGPKELLSEDLPWSPAARAPAHKGARGKAGTPARRSRKKGIR